MKQLISKEWREMRFIPLVYCVLVALIIILIDARALWQVHHPGLYPRFTMDDIRGVLYLGCYLSGWLAGSNAIAPEVGKDTLRFLTVLPSGRWTIWCAKVLSGAIVTVLSLIGVVLTYAILSLCIFGPTDVVASFSKLGADTYVIWILGAVCSYAIALMISTLVEAASVAAILSLVFGLIFIMLQMMFNPFIRSSWITPEDTILNEFCLLLLIIFACFSASAISFCRGGTMRTARRFGYTVATIAIWYVIFTPILAAYADRQFEQYRLQADARARQQHHPVVVQPTDSYHWSGETSLFALSNAVPEYQDVVEIHPVQASMTPELPVSTRNPGANVRSWLTTKTKNGTPTPYLHFVYRINGRESNIAPGHRVHSSASMPSIALLSKTGDQVGYVWLNPIVVK